MSDVVKFLSGDKSKAEDTQQVGLESGQILFGLSRQVDGTLKGSIYYDYYDSKYNIIIGMCIDEKVNSKKLSGSLKSMTEAGYEVLTCDNIAGYGDKVYAEYVEIFVDEETNKVLRVVFYDTNKNYIFVISWFCFIDKSK